MKILLHLSYLQTAQITDELFIKNNNRIELMSMDYGVDSPREISIGHATGRRTHRPVWVKHLLSGVSTSIYNLVTKSEIFSSATIEFFNPESGDDQWFFQMRLTNVSIQSIRQFTDDEGRLLEEFTLIFRTIEETHKDSKTVGNDSII